MTKTADWLVLRDSGRRRALTILYGPLSLFWVFCRFK